MNNKVKLPLTLIFLNLLLFLNTKAQFSVSISGTVQSVDDMSPVIHGSVVLKQKELVIANSFTNVKGAYEFDIKLNDTASILIEVNAFDFKEFSELISINKEQPNSIKKNIFLKKNKTLLKEITIKSRPAPVLRDDTITYNANRFYTVETRKVEDLFKNIEGFKVGDDGRISYRGKAIKSILINDDDLTQDQYTLISRNLNAFIIDSIQVIANYSENRILGSVVKTGETVINLKIKQKLTGKINGSLSTAIGKRFEEDLNILFISQKAKLIQLANVNTVSNTNLSGSIYKLANEEVNNNESSQNLMIYNPLASSSLSLPDLPKEYILDNRDGFSSTLVNTKITKGLKLSGKFTFANSNLLLSTYNTSKTIINDQNRFLINSYQNKKNLLDDKSALLGFLFDSKKNYSSSLKIQYWEIRKKDFLMILQALLLMTNS